jgi:hypothetical protein
MYPNLPNAAIRPITVASPVRITIPVHDPEYVVILISNKKESSNSYLQRQMY